MTQDFGRISDMIILKDKFEDVFVSRFPNLSSSKDQEN